MDRRVLFASLILFAGGATGVGVALFAFVGLDEGAAETEVVWETDPVAGDDGSGAVIATLDGDSVIVQSTVADGERVVRATTTGAGVAWRTPLSAIDSAYSTGAGDDPPAISAFTSGTLGGDPVVAFTTERGALVVLDATDGTVRFALDAGTNGGIEPALGDLTGDGTNELAAAGADGTVLVVDGNGEALFETTLDEPIERRPLIVDADVLEDDTGGLAVATASDGAYTVRLLDERGETRWTTTPAVTPLSWSAVDTRDGPILALGGSTGNLETIEITDGSLRYEVGLQDLPVAVGDASPGQIHVGGAGSVWAVDLLDGEVAWKQQYGGQTRVNSPGVGDVTRDGTAAPVAVNRDGSVLVMSRTGEAVARGDVGAPVVYAGPLFADVTGDGRDEVIVVAEDGRIIAVTG
ncbi:PQQ-binding-like beta-propeller repeat protein [Halorubrum sp. DTA46]|uniref:outer membrane protein assembly factor BamB family protein n=1 Tax=Halorubrum sp. DTA46 TaxID=3402162 RepID=UPI003AAC133C